MEFGFYRPRLRSPADISSLQSKYASVNEANRRADESPRTRGVPYAARRVNGRSRALSELDDDVVAIKSNRDAVAHNGRPCRALTHDFTHSLRQHNSHLYAALCFLLTLNATHAVPSTGFQNDNSTLNYYTPFTRYNLL